MLQPWQTGKVIRIENETAATRRFWIEAPGDAPFDFKPGQFVTLDLPIHERPNKRWRSYSIASWPDGTRVFELVIVLLENGAGTTWLFNEVTVGSELVFRGPQGVFTLPPVLDRDLFLICTGTGVAPFRSMAHFILNESIPHGNIYLIFGTRTWGDALYREELEALEGELTGFHYLPTFSREDPTVHAKPLRTGYVHTHFEAICREKKAQGPHEALFFLCGWKNMIDEAKERILELGYDRKCIHQELYG